MDAQRMPGHSNAKTTRLYDRRNDDIRVGEIERIEI
jgi:integrase/recombinase XerD